MFLKNKAYCFSIGLLILSIQVLYSQNQNVADSLSVLYESGNYSSNELEFLYKIIENESNADRIVELSESLISKASKDSIFEYLYAGFLEKGNGLREKGSYALAINSYFKSIKYAHKDGDSLGVGKLSISIADTYSEMGNSDNAETYYNMGIQILRKTNDSISLAGALLNAGDEYFNTDDYDNALLYFEESGVIYKRIKHLTGTAYNLGNVGMVYAAQGNDILAESNMNEAISILEELEDYYPISVYLIYISDIYLNKEEHQIALDYAHRSLSLAEQYQLKEQISEANLKLSELYEIIGNLEVSYKHYKDHIAYRDSVINLEKVQQIANMRTDYEVSQKQVEVDLLETQKRNQLIILGFIGLLLLASLWFYRTISKEKKKSEKLLLNILPEDTAKELKIHGSVKAKKHESVTVFFSDFKGFTSYSEKLSPEALVETVSFYFSKFDEIIYKHGLEKIKTIGDAYMCAGGLHDSETDHAQRMVRAAFEIAAFVEATKKDVAASELTFDIRIGINTGPVVAGVVGTKKFAYDIWGDTVNVASRMESMSEPGKINISHSTYELIKDDVVCEYRGEIEAKNRGKVKMYFATAIKKEAVAMASG